MGKGKGFEDPLSYWEIHPLSNVIFLPQNNTFGTVTFLYLKNGFVCLF